MIISLVYLSGAFRSLRIWSNSLYDARMLEVVVFYDSRHATRYTCSSSDTGMLWTMSQWRSRDLESVWCVVCGPEERGQWVKLTGIRREPCKGELGLNYMSKRAHVEKWGTAHLTWYKSCHCDCFLRSDKYILWAPHQLCFSRSWILQALLPMQKWCLQ